ncbi:MAG: hypothetical protein ACK5LV_04430 [Lachnospirales bacterium]
MFTDFFTSFIVSTYNIGLNLPPIFILVAVLMYLNLFDNIVTRTPFFKLFKIESELKKQLLNLFFLSTMAVISLVYIFYLNEVYFNEFFLMNTFDMPIISLITLIIIVSYIFVFIGEKTSNYFRKFYTTFKW